jgi:hypothetical protein
MSLEFLKALGHIDGEHRISLISLSTPWFEQCVEVVQRFSPTYTANMASMRELVRSLIELTIGQEEVSQVVFLRMMRLTQVFRAALVSLVGAFVASLISRAGRHHGPHPWRDSICCPGIGNGEERLERIASRSEVILGKWADSEARVPPPQGTSHTRDHARF